MCRRYKATSALWQDQISKPARSDNLWGLLQFLSGKTSLLSYPAPAVSKLVASLLPGTAISAVATNTAGRTCCHCLAEQWRIDFALSSSHGCVFIHHALLSLCNLPLQLHPAAGCSIMQCMLQVWRMALTQTTLKDTVHATALVKMVSWLWELQQPVCLHSIHRLLSYQVVSGCCHLVIQQASS